MPNRLAACDPCRTSKVACDHVRPVCSRCRKEDNVDGCVYRQRPFKRQRRSEHESRSPPAPLPRAPGSSRTPPPFAERSHALVAHAYPNPGFLGDSSHTAIFEQIVASHESSEVHSPTTPAPAPGTAPGTAPAPVHLATVRNASQGPQVLRGSALIDDIRSTLPPSSCATLLKAWLWKGTNLALAGNLLRPCIESVVRVLSSRSSSIDISQKLLMNSLEALNADSTFDSDRYLAQLVNENVRWESLGLVLVAVSRAATDLDEYGELYRNQPDRRKWQTNALEFSDQCLELCLRLDCLNDLQLLLQYENWIAHSMVDGDQSYHSWRKLGDVVSSLFALGYHERIDGQERLPGFLKNLRSTALARTFSGDMNVSIFLGRPPRIHSKYCEIKSVIDGIAPQNDSTSSREPETETPFSYVLESWWSASCALLKEQILGIPKNQGYEWCLNVARDVQMTSERLWYSLPRRFRLEGPLRLCDSFTPVERDFLASAKLNYLHIHFLLRLTLTQCTPEPDAELLGVAVQILNLTVQAIVLKSHVENSGTGHVWKVAYYGLPAAGIICLCLLNRRLGKQNGSIPVFQTIQDLGVLVAHTETGALIHVDEPNYSLLAAATGTVKSLLEKALSGAMTQPYQVGSKPLAETPAPLDWTPWTAEQGGKDFELDFWLNLADHPELSSTTTDSFALPEQ
ncbi:hypothetical protein DOTSEDRAFT_129045 [Dothistroma septosporum NZE10]|uniref:Zn(2)-C6 fungal-type domain-containing protein n=1 Tax=Dothistroma septosporum (strain NZE10 / CBS 128990) TaxID=675120 RepID=N1PS99_DOTSN|nr:hypothetical protein DOTSEDRAFT_129045 [Dothistroma septosporum NZE10]